METKEKLYREIEIRLWRETIYRAVEAMRGVSMESELRKNDEQLKRIHGYLVELGDPWEKKLEAEGYWS